MKTLLTILITAGITLSLSAFAGGGEPVDLDNIKPQETGSQGVVDVHEDEKDVDPCAPEEVKEFDLGFDDEE